MQVAGEGGKGRPVGGWTRQGVTEAVLGDGWVVKSSWVGTYNEQAAAGLSSGLQLKVNCVLGGAWKGAVCPCIVRTVLAGAPGMGLWWRHGEGSVPEWFYRGCEWPEERANMRS